MLYPRLSSPDVPFTSFALFMGVAMSITAFPVLARILADRGIIHTNLGILALGCAAADDITAWCLLAFVVATVKAQVGRAAFIVGGAVSFIALMILVVRPILRRTVARWSEEALPRGGVGLVFILVLASALTTEVIGIHAIFGAFLLGAIIPHDSVVARTLAQQLKSVVTVLLLPVFFAFTGMRTRVDLVSGADEWLICGFIILVAIVGKFGGAFVAARLTGLRWRPAAALGILMNTRGLMELIVLNVGLDLKVLSPKLFSMMVLMAIVTTMMTGPLLALTVPEIAGKRESSAAEHPGIV